MPKVGVKLPSDNNSLTKKQAIEIAKCVNDVEYFIRNYVFVQHPTRGAILFDLYDYQLDVINDLEKYNKNILCQVRQSGKTTTIVAYLLHQTIFFPDVIVGVTAHKGTAAKEIITRFRYAYENLPAWIKPAVESYNVFDIVFSNKSKIMSQTTTETTYRGMSLSILYVDEMAFIKPNIMEEWWKAILPSLSAPGSRMVATSTPNGSEGKFAEIWFKALQGTNDFNPIEVVNEQVPDRDENFKTMMLKDMSATEYAQEYENAFLSSSGTLIYSPVLESLKPKDILDTFGDLRFFKTVRGRKLGVSVDVGTGIGQDYTTIQVFDLETLEQLAEFRNNLLNITDFTKVFIQILKELYNRDCESIYYTIEANSIGMGVTQLLRNATDKILDKAEIVSVGKHDGILTTNKSKMKGCTRLKDLVESERMVLNSKFLISELKFFIKKGASFAAESGKTDDLVMSVVLFCNMIEELAQWEEEVYDTLNNVDMIGELDDDDSDPLPFVF